MDFPVNLGTANETMNDLTPEEVKIPYHRTERGKAKMKAYREAHRKEHVAYKKKQRTDWTKKYPEKVRARLLVGDAVRYKLMEKPEEGEWRNRWEFHHPDHLRPYYGVWLRRRDHSKVEAGKSPCPPCTDYTDIVRNGVLKKWGLE